MNKVSNGPLGKLLRTIGFILVLVASVVLATVNVRVLDIGFINNQLGFVYDFINDHLSFLFDYSYLILTGGIFLLVWTVSRNLFLQIVSSVLAVLVIIAHDQSAAAKVIPFLTLPNISFLEELLQTHHWLGLALNLLSVFFLYLIFGYRKPRRLSVSFMNSAMLILLIALLVGGLPELLNNDWNTKTVFIKIYSGIFGLSFVISGLSSIFGIIGFARS